jgi:hypothetical protein
MTNNPFTVRACAGWYERRHSGRMVNVRRVGRGWVAEAAWDRSLYSDLCATKADAVRCADDFLAQAKAADDAK